MRMEKTWLICIHSSHLLLFSFFIRSYDGACWKTSGERHHAFTTTMAVWTWDASILLEGEANRAIPLPPPKSDVRTERSCSTRTTKSDHLWDDVFLPPRDAQTHGHPPRTPDAHTHARTSALPVHHRPDVQGLREWGVRCDLYHFSL
jgi:hypothetical protein